MVNGEMVLVEKLNSIWVSGPERSPSVDKRGIIIGLTLRIKNVNFLNISLASYSAST